MSVFGSITIGSVLQKNCVKSIKFYFINLKEFDIKTVTCLI